MPIVAGDMPLYASTNIPLDDVSTLGGAIDITNEITNDQFNKIFGTLVANADGGATKYIYGKAHFKNEHASIDLTDGKIYVTNLLDDPTVLGVITFVSDSISDDSNYMIRMYYEDAGGVSTEDIVLNGTSLVSSSASPLINQPIRCELRNATSEVLVTANGNISVYRSATLLGTLPQGYSSATGQIEMFVATSLDDTTTTTDRTTAPGGASWTKPKDYDNGEDCANSGTVTLGTDQAIWFKYTIIDGSVPHEQMQLGITMEGNTT